MFADTRKRDGAAHGDLERERGKRGATCDGGRRTWTARHRRPRFLKCSNRNVSETVGNSRTNEWTGKRIPSPSGSDCLRSLFPP